MKVKILIASLSVATVLLSCKKDALNEPLANPPSPTAVSPNKEALPSNNVTLTLNGTATFQQAAWSLNNIIRGESIPIAGNHTLTTANPILSEMNKYSDYASNVPLDLTVTDPSGGDWYHQYTYTFKNRSNKSMHLDAGIIMFIAPKSSNGDRAYGCNSPAGFGHPQQDYVEVPLVGTPNSWYIARIVFHDVPEQQRTILPGESWYYKIGVPSNPYTAPGWITPAASKKTVRFIADLTGNKNQDIVEKYGTNRFRN